jgi:hypothetical protein
MKKLLTFASIAVLLFSCAAPMQYVTKSVMQSNGKPRPIEPTKRLDIKPGDTIFVVTRHK